VAEDHVLVDLIEVAWNLLDLFPVLFTLLRRTYAFLLQSPFNLK
jgi:hypothetical protein